MEEKNQGKKYPGKDKKRLAVCSSSLGRENRYLVRGQIVDVGINDFMKADDLWDLVTGLFDGQEKDITPFLDFSLAPVRRPILTIEIYDAKEKLVFESEEFNGTEDGFFQYDCTKKLKAGNYKFHVIFKGSDSYRQFTKDRAFLNLKESSTINRKDIIIGMGNLRILPEKYNSFLTTSDIDQTYLATQLGSKKGMVSTIFETADQKLPLPGMPLFYEKLRKDTKTTPLVFISASPHFFRRTLHATIKHHNIEFESLHLKYLDGTIKGVWDKIASTAFNLNELFKVGFNPAVERMKKFFGSTYQSLFDQLSYKLSILLQDRIYQPTKTKEILLGDNTESDYLIFTLYQLILLGELRGKPLEDYLYNLKFLGRDAVTRDQARRIRALADECASIHGDTNSVFAVMINMSRLGLLATDMQEHLGKALPSSINLTKLKKKFKPYIGTEGALGFALNLHGMGVLSFESVVSILSELTGQWLDGKVIDEKYLLSVTRHLSVIPEAEEARQKLYEIVEKALGDVNYR